MSSPGNAVVTHQRNAAAKAKLKAQEEALHKSNPGLAKAKERQAAKLKAAAAGAAGGDTTPKRGKGGGDGGKTPKAKGKEEEKKGAADADKAAEEGKEKVMLTKEEEEEEKKKKEKEAKEKEERAKKKKEKAKNEVKELPPDPNPLDQEWSTPTWLTTLLNIQQVISAALKPPEGDGQGAAFTYIKALSRGQVETLLTAANLGGLTEVLMTGIEELGKQAASTAFVLNNTKFKSEGRFRGTGGKGSGSGWRGGLAGGVAVAQFESHVRDGVVIVLSFLLPA